MRNDRADKATKETENNDSGGTNCHDKEKTLKACQQEYTEKSTLVGTTWREKHDSALTMSPHRQPPPHPILTALLRYAKKNCVYRVRTFFSSTNAFQHPLLEITRDACVGTWLLTKFSSNRRKSAVYQWQTRSAEFSPQTGRCERKNVHCGNACVGCCDFHGNARLDGFALILGLYHLTDYWISDGGWWRRWRPCEGRRYWG